MGWRGEVKWGWFLVERFLTADHTPSLMSSATLTSNPQNRTFRMSEANWTVSISGLQPNHSDEYHYTADRHNPTWFHVSVVIHPSFTIPFALCGVGLLATVGHILIGLCC
jgi:hypothetical protein